MHLTYDRSPELGLALVADARLHGARYVPLADAPGATGVTALAYLRQLHAVANSIASGLTVRQRHRLDAKQWEVLQ